MWRFLMVTLFCWWVSAEVPSPSSEAARDTIAQINHINWVVSKIKTFNNVIVLEEEYRKISPDKLNLNRIPDQETLDKIIAMLDLLHEMIGDERELKEWKRDFELRCKRKQFEFWRGGNQEPGTDGPGAVLSGVLSGSALFPLTRSALFLYRDYVDILDSFEDEAIKKKFEMETAKLNRLHELNKDLLKSQWKMIQDYHFDDALRVSDSDLSLFIEALKDSDLSRVYSRIEAMREKFLIFPLYWYYLSSVALATGHSQVAAEACRHFFEVNRGLFRDDPTIGSVAMNQLLLMEKSDANQAEARRLLALVWKHNAGDIDWRKDYFCASLYASYLKDLDAAKKVLTHAMASLEGSVSDQLHELESTTAGNSERIDFPDGESLWLCKKLMDKIMAKRVQYDEAGLKALCERETTSNIEKLVYVGRMTAPRLWEVIGKEVEEVAVSASYQISFGGINHRIEVSVPVRWLLSGELFARLELLNHDGVVSVFEEIRKERTMLKGNKVKMAFDVSDQKLTLADAIRVSFLHPDYPVSLTFASGSPYLSGRQASAPGLLLNDRDFSDTHKMDDLRLMVASFQHVEYCRDFEKGIFSRGISPKNWKAAFQKTFPHLTPFKAGTISVGTNGVEAIEIHADGSVQIQYKNRSQEKIRPAVSVYFLNRYGVVSKRVDDIWRIKRLDPNATATSPKLDGVKAAAYIDVETAR